MIKYIICIYIFKLIVKNKDTEAIFKDNIEFYFNLWLYYNLY